MAEDTSMQSITAARRVETGSGDPSLITISGSKVISKNLIKMEK
jgi:hypothetical protein